ncbi:MAG TPA: PAS domain S-box protein, partial [Spirochaetota bacterium]|nr:PAS domain S-box protein [Spirochaetota bacterium]
MNINLAKKKSFVSKPVFMVWGTTLVLIFFFWVTDSLIGYLWFNQSGAGFNFYLWPQADQHELIMRFFCVFAFIAGGFIVERMTASLLAGREQAFKLAENFRITLDSIGDGVISTDTKSSILHMNPAACRLTGWDPDQAGGKKLDTVFRIVNSKTGAVAFNPVDRVLQNGGIVGLANDTKLLARNGKEYQIADSAAPVRDATGKLIGVVLVFRNVTTEYGLRQQVEEQKDFLQHVFDSIQDGISVLDPDLNIIQTNKWMEKMYPDPAGLPGQKCYRVYQKRQSICPWCPSVKALQGGTRHSTEVPYPSAENPSGWIELSSFPVKNPAGKVTGVIEYVKDITLVTQARQQLEQSEKEFRLLAETSADIIYKMDLKTGRYTYISPAVEKVFGYTPDQALSLGARDVLTAESYKKQQEAMENALSRGRVYSEPLELDIIHQKGYIVPVEVNAAFICDSQNQPREVIGSARDITARRKRETELKKTRNYIANIINSMPSLLVSVDRDANITHWNKKAEDNTGIKAEKAVGRPLVRILPYLGTEMEKIQQAMTTRQEQQENRRLRYHKGQRCYEDITIYPLVINGTDGAVIRVDNVTRQQQLEEMMVQSEKMLSIGGLAAGMAHEINNPLAGIMQSANVISRRLTDLNLPTNKSAARNAGLTMRGIKSFMEKRKILRLLENINTSGEHAAAIIKNMLSFARPGSDVKTGTDISALLDRCIELAAMDYDLKKQYDFKHITVRREYASNLPEVYCDKGKIQQVIMNILRNGAEAMWEERQQKDPLFILRTVFDRGKAMVRMEIADNGPGMAEHVRKRIFDPFFTTKPVDKGSGL